MRHPSLTVQSAADFSRLLLQFINDEMPRRGGQLHDRPRVEAETPLFATALLDSLSILQLIAAIEGLTGRAVPDDLVVMKHFQTVATITAAFWSQKDL